MQNWSPSSWQQKPCSQPIEYPDAAKVAECMHELENLPPLVTPYDIENLKKELANAAQGKAFLLQGGDCAETFANCQAEPITNKLKILLQMSLILIHGLRKPLIRVGRIGGQYAKPRSDTTETRDGITLPTYRGDLINKSEFTAAARTPNPKLMVQGYQYSAITLNYIRALIDGGFANVQHPENWNLNFVKHPTLAVEYQSLVKSICDSLNFVKTISAVNDSHLERINFFTSHEALNLYYEQPLTRLHTNDLYYNLSTHFPWIGMRTAALDGAHIEFFCGIANPIAVKIGPAMEINNLLKLIDKLNPQNEVGKLTLIMRLGVENVTAALPKYIEAVQKQNQAVLWSCDPMHGNTKKTRLGIKTRRFDDILKELQENFRIHRQLGTHLGGVHFELTGENVTECTGGARGLSEADLSTAYESLLDPRLNYEQALEMAMLIVKSYK